MIKNILALAVAAAVVSPAHALTAGDLSFTSFNADEDGFALVALADIAANTTVFFSDNEWNGTAFNGGESFSSWLTGASTVAAGTVIRFSSTDSSTALAASVGTLSRVAVTGSTNYGFSQTEDTVYAYLGTNATTPTTFLSAVSSGVYGTASAGSLANTGLSVGAGAVQLSAGSDFAEYNGDRSSQTSFAAYKPLVGDVTQWNDLGDGTFAANVPNTTAFTLSPIPEPQTYALMLAGLMAVGFVASRRSSSKR